jgi:hypothetical protein
VIGHGQQEDKRKHESSQKDECIFPDASGFNAGGDCCRMCCHFFPSFSAFRIPATNIPMFNLITPLLPRNFLGSVSSRNFAIEALVGTQLAQSNTGLQEGNENFGRAHQ